MRLVLQEYVSRLCPLLLVTDEDGKLRALDFTEKEARMHRLLARHYGRYDLQTGKTPAEIIDALDAYFAGELAALESVPVATGGTPFQRAVWAALRKIKAGETKSYGEIAAELGRSTASRAVGAANGSNPISIVVPCHRVIGASGALTGYAGSLPRKKWLLDHEREFSQASSQQGKLEFAH